MANDNRNMWGLTHQALPSTVADSAYGPVRVTKYGDVSTSSLWGSKLHGLADQGSLFVATNATPGTAISGIAAADGYDATEALIALRMSATSDKRLYLLWIELQAAAAGTNGTDFAYAMTVDTTSRRSSGGTSITPVNSNMDDATATEVSYLYFGAVVTTAASADVRLVDHGKLRTVIKVIGDKYRFTFGDSSPGSSTGIPLEGTTQGAVNVMCPPVILGAGHTFLLHEFATSQTVAAQYQFKMAWVEA